MPIIRFARAINPSRIVEIPVYDQQTKKGVEFTAADSVNPRDLPGGSSLSPEFEVTEYFWAEADNPTPFKGIDPGEALEIYFEFKDGRD